jgi:4-hydroxybenzoate polyprenyltransferase
MITLYVIIMQMIKAYVALARPRHWLKNILIFIPLLYAHNLTQPGLLLLTCQCFVAFSLVASAVYVLNDIADANSDRRHPIKGKRPIASGQVLIKQAVIYAIVLFLAGFSLTVAGYGKFSVLLFAALYAVLNIVYSYLLKHYVIIDCFCIAAGFLLRVFAGGAASGSTVSEWLFLTMIAASLFMAFGKRRGEMMQISDNTSSRKVLASYDLPFLNGMIFACAGLAVVFYALWAMSNIASMIYTVPIIIYIVSKYLLIVHSQVSHGDPTSIIMGDKGLLAAIGVFGVLSLVLLYG